MLALAARGGLGLEMITLLVWCESIHSATHMVMMRYGDYSTFMKL